MQASRRSSVGLVRRALLSLASVLIALALVGPQAAFAQRGKEKEAEAAPVKGYTLQYFVVGIAVLIIVLPMCWPAMRRWDLPFHGEEE